MEKRLTLAIVLTVIFLIAYQQLVLKKYVPPPKKAAATESVVVRTSPAPAQTTTVNEPAPLSSSAVGEDRVRTWVKETKDYRAEFSNRGATLISFTLLGHKGSDHKPLELVSKRREVSPFAVSGEGADLFNSVYHKMETQESSEGTRLTFTFDDGQGNRSYKEFFLPSQGTLLDFSSRFFVNGRSRRLSLLWGPGLGTILEKDKENAGYEFDESLCFYDFGKVKRLKIKDIKEQQQIPANKWAALDIKYFVALLSFKGNDGAAWIKTVEDSGNGKKGQRHGILLFQGDGSFYLGPKSHDILKAMGDSKENIIDYGFFGLIAKALLFLLQKAYSLIPNYGVAIILVTIVLKLVLLPLTFSSSVSMARMQELQPEIKRIQNRYKKFDRRDIEARQKMNQEVMGLYKEHKINPAGGCLPLFIQLPFLWGFYNLLSASIEIRHQPFFLWIQDLSQKDPIYILPVLMGLTQILLQKMTPSTSTDRNQVFMTYGMSIFMTVLFLNFQSGLVLYWLLNNILQVVQQYFVLDVLKKRKQTESLKKKAA